MENLSGKCVVLGVTGGIAAYKMANTASALKKCGADVHVIMTKNAANFITPITFETLTGHKCFIDTFDRDFRFEVSHIEIAKAADLILIAPASADVIAKLAHGIADDMLTTVVLAARCRKLVAPSMNTAMLDNPITADNIETLKHYGFGIIEPAEGLLACRDTGRGKLPETEVLMDHIMRELAFPHDLEGLRITVTAGPTQEALDPVRYLTNRSSGKMGYAIAKVAASRGADVTLVSGPVNLPELLFVKTVHVVSAAQMADAVKKEFLDCDIVIKAAAVADYRPAKVSDEKIKKHDGDSVLELERTEDILAYIGKNKKPNQFVCGFSMETQNMLENSKAKLEKKNLDMICANSLRTDGAGFGGDTNVVTLITKDSVTELPKMSKEEVAEKILDAIVERGR